MGKQAFFIQGQLPGLNEYTRANRTHKQAGAAMKKQAEVICDAYIRAANPTPFVGRVAIRFLWIEPNGRRDPDNVAFAKKFVLDSLVRCGVIRNDTRRYVDTFEDRFDVDPRQPGVLVEIEEAGG